MSNPKDAPSPYFKTAQDVYALLDVLRQYDDVQAAKASETMQELLAIFATGTSADFMIGLSIAMSFCISDEAPSAWKPIVEDEDVYTGEGPEDIIRDHKELMS